MHRLVRADYVRGGPDVGTPQFPELPPPPREETIWKYMLESIALEELALSGLVNACAEQLRKVCQCEVLDPVSPSEMAEIDSSVQSLLGLVAQKEKILTQKLKLILKAQKQLDLDDSDEDEISGEFFK